ncbi:MAG: GNAT family N-acetyltransferase [Myxococcota bacterium]|nr:GNAT family N-acetyltransferase [Myxococcales bacterium]
MDRTVRRKRPLEDPLTAPAKAALRAFDPDRDYPAIRRCFVELQETERALDPAMPAGEDVADAYLALLFERCREFAGAVIVAEVDGEVAGYAAVWTRFVSDEPDDDPRAHGHLADLVVAAPYRARGIGRMLLRAAEDRVREAGVPVFCLGVKAGNDPALALYASEGFRETELVLVKSLHPPAPRRRPARRRAQ